MLNSLKNRLYNPLVKETFVYTITDVIGKAMSFLLLPLVSFYMPPDELGIATNFTVITSLLSLFAGIAIVNSIPYFYYEQKKDENASMVSNLLLLCFILCTTLICVCITFNHIIYKYLVLDLKIQMLGLIYVVGMLISHCSLIIMRLENKPTSFAKLQVFQIVFHALAVLLFVIVLRGGGIGKIYAEVLVYAIVGVVHFVILYQKEYLRYNFNLAWIKKLLKFGLPLLPHSISFWMKSGMDKIFITTFCGLQFNGLYSMAISISSIYTMLVQSFFNAYTPYLQKRLASLETNKKPWADKIQIVKQTYCLFSIFGILALFAIFVSWVIFNYLIDRKYMPALSYLPLIILSNFIYTLYSFTIQYIYKMKKTMIMGIITFSGSLIQMLLSYLLIGTYGVIGAVYSLFFGNILISVGISIYSNKVYKMPWFYFLRITS